MGSDYGDHERTRYEGMNHFSHKQRPDGLWGVYDERDNDCVTTYTLEGHAALDVSLFEARMNDLDNQELNEKVTIFIFMMRIMKERGMKV